MTEERKRMPLGFGLATTDDRGEATFRATPRLACVLERIVVAGSAQMDEAQIVGLVFGTRIVLRRPWPLAMQSGRGNLGLPAPWQVLELELEAKLPIMLTVRVPDGAGVVLTCGFEVTRR